MPRLSMRRHIILMVISSGKVILIMTRYARGKEGLTVQSPIALACAGQEGESTGLLITCSHDIDQGFPSSCVCVTVSDSAFV